MFRASSRRYSQNPKTLSSARVISLLTSTNGKTGQMGFSTKMSGKPTTQDLRRHEGSDPVTIGGTNMFSQTVRYTAYSLLGVSTCFLALGTLLFQAATRTGAASNYSVRV